MIQHFIRLYAGLIAEAQQSSDMNAVSFTVEKIVEYYESEYELAVQEHENQVDNCRVITR